MANLVNICSIARSSPALLTCLALKDVLCCVTDQTGDFSHFLFGEDQAFEYPSTNYCPRGRCRARLGWVKRWEKKDDLLLPKCHPALS